jgi:hypothetical protein
MTVKKMMMPATIKLRRTQFLTGPRKRRPCLFGSKVGLESAERRKPLRGRVCSASHIRDSTPRTTHAAAAFVWVRLQDPSFFVFRIQLAFLVLFIRPRGGVARF